jgi:hypothetical protein
MRKSLWIIALLFAALGAPNASADTVNFDSINVSPGSTVDISTTNYLAQYGITLANVTANTKVNVFNANGTLIVAPSSPNVIVQQGNVNGESYTLQFSTPLSSFSFDVAGNSKSGGSGTLVAAWSATAYNSSNMVVSSAGDPSLLSTYSPFAPKTYTLAGPGISYVTFSDNCAGVCGTQLLIDNLSSPELTQTPEPSTYLLLGTGLLGLLALAARSKRHAPPASC